MSNYIGPQFQLSPPDYSLAVQELEALGRKLAEIGKALWESFKRAMQPLIDVFSNWPYSGKSRRSKLRLKRHKTQHEKRIAWNAAYMQKIYAKEANIYLRRMRIA